MIVAIGLDGGGSETAVVRADSGVVAYGPASNPSAVGIEAASQAMCTAIRSVEPVAAVNVFAGVAGAGRSEIAKALAVLVESALPIGSRVHVEGDARIALRALIPEGPGVVLVSGTGSFAYAESGQIRARAGGAGYLLGDEGSGFAVGLAALRLYIKILEGRAHDAEFAEVLRTATGIADRDSLLEFVYQHEDRVSRVAAVAPEVVRLAGAGHRGATKIIQQASAELADLARAAARDAGLLESAPAVGLYGGQLRHNSILTFLLETRIAAEIPGASIVRCADADGAARAAARFAAQLTPA